MGNTVDSLLARFLAERPNATAREVGEHGMKIVTSMVNDGKFQEGADFIHAWMNKFSEASRTRIAAASQAQPNIAAAVRTTEQSALRLPVGISGGKVAAIIAGVGLAAGAHALLREKKQPESPDAQPRSWAGQ